MRQDGDKKMTSLIPDYPQAYIVVGFVLLMFVGYIWLLWKCEKNNVDRKDK